MTLGKLCNDINPVKDFIKHYLYQNSSLLQSSKLAIIGVIVLISLGSLGYVYAAPSANLTLASGQTTPAQTYKDNSGITLWQYITSPISTLLSKFIIIYPTGLTHIRGYQFPDANTTVLGNNITQTVSGSNNFTNSWLNFFNKPTILTPHRIVFPTNGSGTVCLRNQTGSCGTSVGVITSINGDGTAAQVLSGTAGNVSLIDAGPTHTLNLGSNVFMTNGHGQTVPKSVIFNNATTFNHIQNIPTGKLNYSNHIITFFPNSGTVTLGNQSQFDPLDAQEMMFVNKTNSASYILVNASNFNVITSGTDAGLILQTGINAISKSTGGMIFVKAGNYTVTTPLLINKSAIYFSGENMQSGITTGNTQGGGRATNFRCNVGAGNDCFTLTATSGPIYDVGLYHFSMTRSSNNSARYLIACFGAHICQHDMIYDVGVYDLGTPNFADITIQAGDWVVLDHISTYRNAARSGSETQTAMIWLTGDVETWIIHSHIQGGGGLSTSYDGIMYRTSTIERISDTTFDYLRYPIQTEADTTQNDIMLSNVDFCSNYKPYPLTGATNGGLFSGSFSSIPSCTIHAGYTPVMSNMTIDKYNNFTDSTDRTKAFQFVESGLLTNHVQKITPPSDNFTMGRGGSFNSTTATNKTGTSSTSQVMYGSPLVTTLNGTGKTQIEVSFETADSALSGGCRGEVRYSTGFMGGNGVAATGTQIGSNIDTNTAAANEVSKPSFSWIVQLTKNTKYYFDLSFANNGAAGTCTLSNVDWTVHEIQ